MRTYTVATLIGFVAAVKLTSDDGTAPSGDRPSDQLDADLTLEALGFDLDDLSGAVDAAVESAGDDDGEAPSGERPSGRQGGNQSGDRSSRSSSGNQTGDRSSRDDSDRRQGRPTGGDVDADDLAGSDGDNDDTQGEPSESEEEVLAQQDAEDDGEAPSGDRPRRRRPAGGDADGEELELA